MPGMGTANLPLLRAAGAADAQRGPHDDFYCWKYQVWYPSRACIFRHSRRTYPACSDCFQGRLNLRHAERGLPVPIGLPPESGEER